MKILDAMARGGFEQVIVLSDPSCGLAGFMVFHDTTRGPATGGIRLYPYQSEDEALADGLKLARAMTFKAAVADLPVGGGKIVLIDNTDLIREDALRAVGRAIQSLGGRFLAGRDVGVPVEQGQWVRSETRFMVDESDEGVGDLNRATAWGVEAGARAAMEFRLGASDWKGVRVAIQGAGGVGGWLARILAERGADLVLSDPQPSCLENLAGSVSFKDVGTDEIYSASDSIFCPCAIGGVLNPATLDKLTARVVAGSANNVLSQPEIGKTLFERGVAYVPDYLVNAGALIQGVRFVLRGERDSGKAIRAIGARTHRLLEMSAKRGEPPDETLENETLARLVTHRSWRHWCWPSRESD